jgi:YD repeat-containing protein
MESKYRASIEIDSQRLPTGQDEREARARQTRSIDVMNRLTQIGGAGSTVVEGQVNELADITVNSQPAELRHDPISGGYRYRRENVPVTPGSNTINITATDKDNPPNTSSQDWQFTVPSVQRTFTYDANGNTLSDGQRLMTWDAKNRLKTVTKNGTTWEWAYDSQDRRVREYQYPAGGTRPTAHKQFVWIGQDMVQEGNRGTEQRDRLTGREQRDGNRGTG